MSHQEQRALVAWLNTYKLSKRITAFEQLADGKALMDVMNQIDASYFKNTVTRGLDAPTNSPSSENWVTRMNLLKRLYRLLLSYSFPAPHPANLSSTTLPEPPFAVIAKSPTTRDGSAGLLQICRFCVVAATWGSKNEDVILRIQGLEEAIMVELMQSIELITSSVSDDTKRKDELPYTTDAQAPPSLSDSQEERDMLLLENEELRSRYNQAMEQVAEVSTTPDERQTQSNEELEQVPTADSILGVSALRTSQTSHSEAERLRVDLAMLEDQLVRTQADLDKQHTIVADLTRTVDRLKSVAKEVDKLKDQLDEYRYTAERLQKSENVIEKYKKKLAEQAGMRRELRALEEANASLINVNSTIEGELRRTGVSRDLVDTYEKQLATLEDTSRNQLTQMAHLDDQLETARLQLADTERAYEREREELQSSQQRVKELELGSGYKRDGSSLSIPSLRANLGDELEDRDAGTEGTKSELKMRIQTLERQLADVSGGSSGGQPKEVLQTLLLAANEARDQYQTDYLEAHRSSIRLQANLEQIRAGQEGESAQTAITLRQRLDETIEERDALLRSRAELNVAHKEVKKQSQSSSLDLSLVGENERDMVASKKSDPLNMKETKRLLVQKHDMPFAGVNPEDIAVCEEKEFSDFKESLTARGVPAELHRQMLELYERNRTLEAEVEGLSDRLRAQDKTLSQRTAVAGGDFGEAQRSHEAQIHALEREREKAKAETSGLEKRYRLEQQLMLSAWHDLGMRTVRDHLNAAAAKRSQPKAVPSGWLGRQRRHQDEAAFSRA